MAAVLPIPAAIAIASDRRDETTSAFRRRRLRAARRRRLRARSDSGSRRGLPGRGGAHAVMLATIGDVFGVATRTPRRARHSAACWNAAACRPSTPSELPGRLIAWLAFVLVWQRSALYAAQLSGAETPDDLAYRYSSSVAALVQYGIMLGILAAHRPRPSAARDVRAAPTRIVAAGARARGLGARRRSGPLQRGARSHPRR